MGFVNVDLGLSGFTAKGAEGLPILGCWVFLCVRSAFGSASGRYQQKETTQGSDKAVACDRDDEYRGHLPSATVDD